MTHRYETFETISFGYEKIKGTQYANSIHMSDLLCFALVVVNISKGKLKGRLQKIPSGMIFLTISFLTASFSIFNSEVELINRSFFAISANLRMLLFYFFLSYLLRDFAKLRWLLRVFATLIIFTFVLQMRDRYLYGMNIVQGHFMTPNQACFILAGLTAIMFALSLNNMLFREKSRLFLLAFLTGPLAIILTQNRGGLINLFISCGFVLVVDLLFKFRVKKVVMIWLLTIGATGAVIKSYDTFYNRFFGHASNVAGTSLRKTFYVIAYENFKLNPMLGLGINQFGNTALNDPRLVDKILNNGWVNKDYRLRATVTNYINDVIKMSNKGFALNDPRRAFGICESFWFLCLSEYGLIGFIPLVVAYLFFLFQGVVNIFYFRGRHHYFYALSLGFTASTLGMIVHGMTEWCLRQSQAMYFVAMYFAVTSLCTYMRRQKAFYSEEAPPPFATLGTVS